jgi:hypothetical protein
MTGSGNAIPELCAITRVARSARHGIPALAHAAISNPHETLAAPRAPACGRNTLLHRRFVCVGFSPSGFEPTYGARITFNADRFR